MQGFSITYRSATLLQGNMLWLATSNEVCLADTLSDEVVLAKVAPKFGSGKTCETLTPLKVR